MRKEEKREYIKKELNNMKIRRKNEVSIELKNIWKKSKKKMKLQNQKRGYKNDVI